MSSILLPLLGGVLIGTAASLLLLFNGRIAGISGIAGGLFGASPDDRAWRLAFVGGLVLGGAAMAVVLPSAIGTPLMSDAGLTVAAGLLVGFGTRLANGCTSGHGICGISRGSARSIAATVTFMIVGALTVFVTRHVWGGLS